MAALLFVQNAWGGVFAHCQNTVELTGTADSAFVTDSHPIIFVVNRTDISPEDEKWLTDTLRAGLQAIDPNGIIVGRAAASPDGPYGNNRILAEGRRKAADRILRRLGYNTEIIHYDVVAEDYTLLLAMMRLSHDEDCGMMDSLVSAYAHEGARLKAELKAADGGRLWQRLLRDYFPSLRAVRIMPVDGRLLVDGTLMPDLRQGEFPQTASTARKGRLAEGERTLCPLTDYSPLTAYGTGLRVPRRELLSVKTNLLFDFAYMPGGYDRFCPIPNIAVEFYPLHGHFTYGASFDCPWWQDYEGHKFFQVRNYQLEARYYLKSGDVDKVGYGNGAAFRGLYAQAYVHAGLFSICFDKKRGWEGEGAGAGLGLGYMLPLTRTGHWRLEFGAQFGVFFSKYDPYQYESVIFPDKHDGLYYYKFNNYGNFFTRRQHRFTWLGPTRVGITLSYDLLYRRRVKKGTSFKSWEVQR